MKETAELKPLLMALVMLLTVEEIADFMLLKAVVAAVFAPLLRLVTVFLMPFHALETALPMAVATEVMAVLIPFQMPSMNPLMAFHTVVAVVWIPVHALLRKVAIAVTTVVNSVVIPSQSPVKKSLMPFHTVSAVLLIASHA